MLIIKEEKCIGCGQCLPICPKEALQVWGVAEVKKENCDDCLICTEYCPVDALEVKR